MRSSDCLTAPVCTLLHLHPQMTILCSGKTTTQFSYSLKCGWTLGFFGHLFLFLLLLLEEVVAGNSQSCHQHNKLIEIHLVVLVRVQVIHDFLHQHGIFLRLKTKHKQIVIQQICNWNDYVFVTLVMPCNDFSIKQTCYQYYQLLSQISSTLLSFR